MTADEELELHIHSLLTLAKGLNSFTLEGTDLGTHRAEGWMGISLGLNTLENISLARAKN
jgi:hypothetical protein